jgi:hypothetical protein
MYPEYFCSIDDSLKEAKLCTDVRRKMTVLKDAQQDEKRKEDTAQRGMRRKGAGIMKRGRESFQQRRRTHSKGVSKKQAA